MRAPPDTQGELLMPALRKLTVVVILLGSALHATADLPADRTVTYLIRSSDTDPEALPALEIAMTLHAVDDDGPAVGWAISRIEFRRLNGEDPADV